MHIPIYYKRTQNELKNINKTYIINSLIYCRVIFFAAALLQSIRLTLVTNNLIIILSMFDDL